jgi:hypothetical protein
MQLIPYTYAALPTHMYMSDTQTVANEGITFLQNVGNLLPCEVNHGPEERSSQI